MKTLRKVQAIIYDIKNNRPYFLIMHRILRWKGWEIPKETIEPGETLKQTLIRGIKEETHLKNYKIVRSLDITRTFISKGKKYKVVKMYIVHANMKQKISLKQKVIEHDKYRWVTKEVLLQHLTYSDARNNFKAAYRKFFK